MIPAVHATPGARAVAVASSSVHRGEALARECDVPRSYTSIEQILADPDVDVVYISSVNELHAEQAVAAAQAGKSVLCEKPLATTYADGMRVCEACESAGVVLGTNHQLRAAGTIRAMRQLIADNAIGDLVAARIAFLTSLPVAMRTWRLQESGGGGGVALDLTVHDADTLRFVLDDEIVEVSASARSDTLGQGRVFDSIRGVMLTSRGLTIDFHDSFLVPHAGTFIDLHGTTGSLLARDVIGPDPTGEVMLQRDHSLTRVDVGSRRPLYERMVAAFNAAVRGQGPPLCSGRDGLASLAIALAAVQSAQTGRPSQVPDIQH